MNNEEKQFENFISQIKFDDTIDPNHRDRLEQNLLSALAKQNQNKKQITTWRTIINSKITRLTAAAAIIIIAGVSFLAIRNQPSEQINVSDSLTTAKSPIQMMTAMSLSIAYRKGGLEAMEKQCDQALELLGPRPASLTVNQLLADFNGS